MSLTHRAKVKVQLAAALLLGLLAQTAGAGSEDVPDIELLEFLGTIAGLESMGIEIDELLAGSETDTDDDASVVENESGGIDVDTSTVVAVDKGENNE